MKFNCIKHNCITTASIDIFLVVYNCLYICINCM
nr:MAG TPA: hypothetical protein [Caudoviricetes sp.]